MSLCYLTEGKNNNNLVTLHIRFLISYVFLPCSYGLSEGRPTEKGLKIDAQVRGNENI